MGCTTSMTSVKLNRQHPDIQINVIEPSTAVHQDNLSSSTSTSTFQTLGFKASNNVLQVTETKKRGRCHLTGSSFGESSTILQEQRWPFSDGSKNMRSRRLCPASSTEGAGWKSTGEDCSSISEDTQNN